MASAYRPMPVLIDAPVMRSGFRPKKIWRSPAPSSPTRRSAATSTLSKNSVNCFSGARISTAITWRSRPSASVSTMNSDRRARPVCSSVPVRATTSTCAASSTPEMYVFVPRRRQTSPSRVAVVEMLWLFDPASGSVMANTIFSPVHSPGSQRCFWASSPKRLMTSAEIAAETRMSSRGHPAAANSSQTMASSLMPPPPPPYSSGRCTARKPRSAMACQSSSVFSPVRVFSWKYS